MRLIRHKVESYVKRYTVADVLGWKVKRENTLRQELVDEAIDADDAPRWANGEGCGSVEYDFQAGEFVVTVNREA